VTRDAFAITTVVATASREHLPAFLAAAAAR